MRLVERELPLQMMARLERRVEAELGLSFRGPRLRDLGLAVQRMAETGGFEDARACAEWLLADGWDTRKETLAAHHLTIGETYFFREPRAFELLCDYARRKLADSSGQVLRLWSAGCCTGEEAYSMAIALRQALPFTAPERISILGTDLSPECISAARAGVYRQWSFRTPDAGWQEKFFVPAGEGRLRVVDALRQSIRFAELNLALPVYPSLATGTLAMDIIFCRNVLIYFSREQARRVIARLRECLVEGGWLVVSPSEASSELFAGFIGHYFPDAIYFRKCSETGGRGKGPGRNVGAADWRSAETGGPEATKPASQQVRAEPALSAVARQPAGRPAGRSSFRRSDAAATTAIAATAAIETAPRTSEVVSATGHYEEAMAALEAGEPEHALQGLKRVLYLQPDFVPALYQTGVLHLAQGRPAQARRAFAAACELLDALDDEALVPGTEGLHAGYLRESIRIYLDREKN